MPTLTVGDTAPTLTGTVSADLTGATDVSIHIRCPDKSVIDRPVTVVDAGAGEWSMSFEPDDLVRSGYYKFEVQVTFSTGLIQTFAKDATGHEVGFTVRKEIDGPPSTPLTPTQYDLLGARVDDAQAYAVQRANHTGTQSADTITDGTTNKAFLATERTKLSGIATSATANDTDANLKARANHTGTQTISTVTGLQTALDAKLASPPTYTLAGRPTATGSLAVIFVSDVAGGQLQQDTAASTWTPLAPGVSQGALGLVASASITANATGFGTTVADVPGLSVTWTAVAGATYWVFAKIFIGNTASAVTTTGYLTDGSNTVVDTGGYLTRSTNDSQIMTYQTFQSPAAGSTTYKIRLNDSTGPGGFVLGSATFPGRLNVFRVA